MVEFFKRRERQQKNVLEVEEGQIFLPFRNKTEFIPVDLDKAQDNQNEPTILEQEILFKGIYGKIAICANPEPLEKAPITPLGPAHLKATFDNGNIELTEAPCYIEVEFDIRNQNQYDLLRNFELKVFLNDDVYYLSCDGDTDPEFAFHEFRRGETLTVSDSIMKDTDGDEVEILLPQNLNILSAIKMRITEYDDDDDDDFEQESPTPSNTPDYSPVI